MNSARSLRRLSLLSQLMVSHAIVAGAVATICGVFIIGSWFSSEDRLYRRLVEHAADAGWESWRATGSPSWEPSIRLLDPSEPLPSHLPVSLAKAAAGSYEFEVGGLERHVVVRADATGRRLLAVGEYPETETGFLLRGLVLVVGLCAAGGWAYGFFHARRALRPAVQLAEALDDQVDDPQLEALAQRFRPDEIGTIAKRLQQFVARRRELVQREQRFVRDASHELRTPLTILRGATELLRSDPEADPELVSERIARMERSLDRMQYSVESLLWLARLESEAERAAPLDLSAALSELCRDLDAKRKSGVRLELHIAPRLDLQPPQHLWTIVVRNLLENALRHTEHGTVEVVLRDDLIRVRDTGSGIPQELLSTLTEAWMRGPGTPGYGLGLSITRRIVERLDGELSIESELGRGTTVTIVPSAPSTPN